MTSLTSSPSITPPSSTPAPPPPSTSNTHAPNPPSSTLTSLSNNPSDTFAFPPHYSFPPFFTLQPIHSTRTSQLHSWSTLIQSWARHHRLFALTLSSVLESHLFHNPRINRRLSLRDARAIITYMTTPEGGQRAEWIDATISKAKKEDVYDEESKTRCYIFWRRPEEWATVLEEWVEDTGQKGTVLTLYELTESDATRRTEFHGMEEKLLERCLKVCVKRGKAQMFGEEGSMGVKFF